MDKQIKDKILNNVVDPRISSNFNFCKGKIVNYDNIRNRADVTIVDKNIGTLLLESVPIQTTGFISSNIKKDDLVNIMFLNNSILLPKIIGKCDEGYELFTRQSYRHLKQGSLLIDTDSIEVEEISPMSDTWIVNDNTDINKYYEWFSKDIEDQASDLLLNLGFYSEGEVGFTNPSNKSTIKVDKEGNILIFTDTNNGIMINSENKTINVYGNNININCNSININTKSFKLNGKEMCE